MRNGIRLQSLLICDFEIGAILYSKTVNENRKTEGIESCMTTLLKHIGTTMVCNESYFSELGVGKYDFTKQAAILSRDECVPMQTKPA